MTYEQALDAFRRGDDVAAGQLARELLDHAGEVTDRVDALCMLARVALRAGDLDTVASCALAAETAARASGNRRLQRMPLHLQAVASRMAGDHDEARNLYRASIALNEELGERRMAALEHRNLAYVELSHGHPGRARALIEESRRQLRELDTTSLTPYLTFDEATTAAIDGDLESAALKLTEAEEQFAAAGVVPDPDDAAEIERLRARLGR